MKISTMLKREDFYLISKNTLKKYFSLKKNKNCDIEICGRFCRKFNFYIYPHLNAILTKNTNRKVKKYLETEYNIQGNSLRRIFIKIYIFCCLKFPRLFAHKALSINLSQEYLKTLLIYPCNRKIRIFNFGENEVDVIVKDGFSDDAFKNEIKIRTELKEDFILPILNFDQQHYTEKIIDGMPLARVLDLVHYDESRLRVTECLSLLNKKFSEKIKLHDYAKRLELEIQQKTEKLDCKNIEIIKTHINEIISRVLVFLKGNNNFIHLTLSHGDLQHGNIWVENQTDKIYIIDWESACFRSVYYDMFWLFNGTRSNDKIFQIFQNEEYYNSVKKTYKNIDKISVDRIILLEDISYKITENNQLPNEYGSKKLKEYLNSILVVLKGNENV